MRFTITGLARCSGGGHYSANISIEGGALKPITFTQAEILAVLDEADSRERIINRVKAVILEAGATTLAQIRTAIESKEFKV